MLVCYPQFFLDSVNAKYIYIENALLYYWGIRRLKTNKLSMTQGGKDD